MNINPLGSNSLSYLNQSCSKKEFDSKEKFSLFEANSNEAKVSLNRELKNSDIEKTGNLLQNSLSSFMDGAAEDGKITVEEIFAYAEKYHNKADKVLDDTVKKLGIPLDTEITIDTNGKGEIKVSVDPPVDTVKKLEQTLNNHPEFQQQYIKASSFYSLGKAAERQAEFSKIYAQNPQAAVKIFGIEYEPNFIMKYLNGETQMIDTKYGGEVHYDGLYCSKGLMP